MDSQKLDAFIRWVQTACEDSGGPVDLATLQERLRLSRQTLLRLAKHAARAGLITLNVGRNGRGNRTTVYCPARRAAKLSLLVRKLATLVRQKMSKPANKMSKNVQKMSKPRRKMSNPDQAHLVTCQPPEHKPRAINNLDLNVSLNKNVQKCPSAWTFSSASWTFSTVQYICNSVATRPNFQPSPSPSPFSPAPPYPVPTTPLWPNQPSRVNNKYITPPTPPRGIFGEGFLRTGEADKLPEPIPEPEKKVLTTGGDLCSNRGVHSDGLLAEIAREYGQARGAKLANLRARNRQGTVEALHRADQELGREELLSRLREFLADESPALAAAHWPIERFLDRVRVTPSRSQPSPPPVSRPEPPALRKDSSMSGRPDIIHKRQRFIDLWNYYVDRGLRASGWNPAWDKWLEDSDLMDNLDAVFEKANALASGDEWKSPVSIAWLFKEHDGEVNWQRLLGGEFDWAMGESDLPEADVERYMKARAIERRINLMLDEAELESTICGTDAVEWALDTITGMLDRPPFDMIEKRRSKIAERGQLDQDLANLEKVSNVLAERFGWILTTDWRQWDEEFLKTHPTAKWRKEHSPMSLLSNGKVGIRGIGPNVAYQWACTIRERIKQRKEEINAAHEREDAKTTAVGAVG